MRHRASRRFAFFWLVIFTTLLLNRQPELFSSADEQVVAPVINEFLAANQTGLTDEDGDYSDWIEIYNPHPQAINLSGWALTDDPAQPDKWSFPNIRLDGQAYLLIFASGKNRKAAESELHTNFKLDHASEFLGLYHQLEDRFVDIGPAAGLEEGFPEQFKDISYGRYGHEPGYPASPLTFGYFARPTPGQPNAEAPLWLGLAGPVNFSIPRGFYQAPFTVELSTPTPGATIRYTTDGSAPTETHGTIYTSPIPINATTLLRAAAFKPDLRPAPVETHSYIFLDDVLAQPQNPAGFPRSWGGYQGAPVSADYEMDPEVVNDSRYHGQMKEALQSLPTISIVTEMKSFHDLYANPRRRGRAWERPVSVEFIDPQPGRPGFHVNAGLRIQGELGRSEYMPKHAFRIFFRNEYGAGKLGYPLFPGSTVEKFDTLILRSGVNRSYAGFPKREEDIKLTTYSRDEWLRASQLAMSGFGARGLFVHLYLNGLYWGLYNLVERPDVPFVASHFGGREEDWEVISHEETTTNTSERFKTLHRLAAEGGLEDPEKYAAINQYLDIPHFIDYLILNWYTGNLDWGFNNWYAAVQNPSGQVRYFVWDGERTWYEGAEIYMELDEYLDRPNLVRPLLEALLKNPDFRIELADRLYKHLYNDGALSEANAQLRWLAINQMIEPAIVAESARWGDTRFETPLTQEDWRQARADVHKQMTGNADKLIRLAREAGYYPELDPPLFQRHDDKEAGSAHLTITSTAPEGTAIYYTTDGSDPRQAGTGAVSPGAQRYSDPVVLAMPTTVKARAFAPAEGIWSPLNETVFNDEDSLTGRLQITEIMYNPLDGDDYEFIELKNVGNASLDLAGFSFEGIRFTFPPVRNELAPGELVVLVKNPAAFSQKYPHVTVAGTYQGQLSNQGERIAVKDATGKIILSVEYDDRNGWPVSPDGRGDSLVLVGLAQDPNEPGNWQAGRDPHGSPGTHSP